MGILKKMTEGTEEEFPEALLPLLEIDDEEKQVELTKEHLEFIAKVFTAHHKRLEAEAVNKALKPIFRERTKTMIPTIFEEKFMEGEAEFGRNAVLDVLRTRFKKVPRKIETAVQKMNDPIALKSLNVHAAICQTLDEFAGAVIS